MVRRALFVAGCFLALGCGSADGFGEELGAEQDPIIGGTTDNGDPSVVAIFAHQPGSSSGSICSGAVISSTKVLTAAHCVDPAVVGDGNVFEVLFGTTLSLSNSLAVVDTAFDEEFDVNNLTAGHDIGIVTLAEPTTLTPLAFNRGALGRNQVRIVGYGMNTHNANAVNNGVGTKRTATTTITASNSILVQIGNSQKQTCHGDSGGPAFQKFNGVEKIIGVTSFGSDRSTASVCFGGGFDTRVDAFTDFIDANL